MGFMSFLGLGIRSFIKGREQATGTRVHQLKFREYQPAHPFLMTP